MHVPEIIQQAVSGILKFQFIESTITASCRGTLSSQKGTGLSESRQGGFRYVFHPRTPLQPVWVQPGGYLDPLAPSPDVEFTINGTERGGAQWSAKVPALLPQDDVPGKLVIEADVDEWWCNDSRSVSSSFVRGIVPGARLYPVNDAIAGGAHRNRASVCLRGVTVEFRDHGSYTEIFAQSSASVLPSDFVDDAVSVLGGLVGVNAQLVYKEEHIDRRRRMCVRSLAHAPVSPGIGAPEARGFWNRYREQLSLRLESVSASRLSG